MKEEYKLVLEKTLWTFVQAFLGALTVAPLVGVDANAIQLAAISGASASLVVIKEFAKKQLTVVEKKVSK
jgi:hypothetical protein